MPDTIQALAAKIKKQHPVYANVDDKELVSKVITKYPQYVSSLNASDVLQLSPSAYAVQNARKVSAIPTDQAASAPAPKWYSGLAASEAGMPMDIQNPQVAEANVEGQKAGLAIGLPVAAGILTLPAGVGAASLATGGATGASELLQGRSPEEAAKQAAVTAGTTYVGGRALEKILAAAPGAYRWARGMKIEAPGEYKIPGLPIKIKSGTAAQAEKDAELAAQLRQRSTAGRKPSYTPGGGEPTYGKAAKIQTPRVAPARGASAATEATPVAEAASEGRPATWTNQRVVELATKSKDPLVRQQAIEQARLRKLNFPGARFVTGEGSPFERNMARIRNRFMAPLVKGTGEEGVLRIGGPRNVAAARASGLVGRATETAKDIGYGLTNPQAPRELRQIGQNFRSVTGSPDRILMGQLERRGLSVPKEVHPAVMDEMGMLVEELPADLTLRQRRLVDTALNRQYTNESEIFNAITDLRDKLGLGVK